MGYVNFYLLTTIIAFPGIILFWFMMRSGLADDSIGDAGIEGPGDARRDGDETMLPGESRGPAAR